jgi:serine/threonine-protein kinase
MVDRDRCQFCGEALPADSAEGVCRVCGMRAVGAGETPTIEFRDGHTVGNTDPMPTFPSSQTATSAPGTLSRLAETIAVIPRVSLRDPEASDGPDPVDRAPSTEPPDATSRVARLQLLDEVARGGMGVIIKGRDSDLGRELAVKVLLEQHREKADLIRRFVEEAQISGQLQHPGIVPVYELGTLDDRRPYFAMKLVKGHTLAALLAERAGPKDDQARLLGIFEQVCLTMAYAHSRGVIHRDLKPSNVMVGNFGEVQVMDWGLAKVLPQGGVVDEPAETGRHETVIQTARAGVDSGLSQAGSVMGTPAYMPPQQASGDFERLDERADVFALGSILCEILTDQPAFTGRTVGEIQRKAARGELDDAFGRLDACGADAELVELARDCLAFEPDDRLRDAGAVTERLTAYLARVQERLRAAELARVEAQARAEEEAKRRVLSDALAQEAQAHTVEERRRRRLQVGLAASVLALTTVGGLAVAAYIHHRQARAAQVELALNETMLLYTQALNAPDDPNRWPAAREAIRRVEVALGDGGDAQAQNRLDDLRREVEEGSAAASRDNDLLDAVAEIRSRHLGGKAGVTDMAYAETFRRAGIDLDNLTPAVAAARIRTRPATVVVQLLPHLDSWSLVRRNDEQPPERWQRPLTVARAIDSDPFRNRLRALVEHPKIPERGAALRTLAEDPHVADLPPASVLQLASALREAGEQAKAISLLESAAQRVPDDVWINYNLAEVLAEIPARREEAVRYYTAARALRPESAHNLGHLLDEMGRGDDAIATFRALVNVRPTESRNIGCLATVLLGRQHHAEGRKTLDQAIAAARETIRLRPSDAGEYHILGHLLNVRGDQDGAIAAYREALRIEPGHTGALANLVAILKDRGDQDGAITVLRAAIRARPDHPWPHEALSAALKARVTSAAPSSKSAKPFDSIPKNRRIARNSPRCSTRGTTRRRRRGDLAPIGIATVDSSDKASS